MAFQFQPTRLREKWVSERREEAKSLAELGTPVMRLGARKPRLAMVSTEDCWRGVGEDLYGQGMGFSPCAF